MSEQNTLRGAALRDSFLSLIRSSGPFSYEVVKIQERYIKGDKTSVRKVLAGSEDLDLMDSVFDRVVYNDRKTSPNS